MWTPIALFVILAAAASAEHGFKTGTEYKYEVTSKTLTSLQQVSDQYSGVVLRAQLTVTPMKDDELIAYITKPETAQVHTTLRRGVEQEIPQDVVQYTPLALSKEPFVIKMKEGIVDELVVSKELPVWEVNIIRSIVSQFQIDTQGKRLIPSKINTVPHGEENTGVYKIMEDTVEGECEVLYDVTPLPKYILQTMPSLAPTYHLGEKEELIDIMKTKNFTNCEQRPGYHFGFTGLTNWKPTTNKMGNFLSRSSVSRVVLSGNLKTYTIQSSVTTNKVILSPEIYNSQKGEVVSRMNLTLVSVQTGSQNVQGPQNPQTLKKLVYDFNGPFTTDAQIREKWDQRQEQNLIKTTGTTETGLFPEQMRSTRSIDEKTLILANEGWYQTKPKMSQAPETPFLPYFVGYSGHSIQHSKELNVNQVVRKIAEQLGQALQDQTHLTKESTLEKFSILTKVLRTMNVKQLEQVVQELYTPEKENSQEVTGTARNTWMVLRDALAQAGTGPALMTITNLITTQKLKGEEAAQVVSVLTETTRYPTTEYMNTFFELVKNPKVVTEAHLNTSAIYAFTKLVRLAQVNQKTLHNRYPVHAFGYLTSQDENTVVETYIPYFAQQLEQAIKEGDSHKIQTYIKALGNIAHPKIVQVFEPYLEGKQPMSDFQRTLVVVSLSKLTEVHPKLARSLLYKIYANTGEVYQVRVAAVYNLMKTNPPASMLQRMAQFTHEDPSYQVRSAVKSAIESAALLTTKDNSELRQNALSAVNMLTPKVYGVQYSRLNLTDYVVKGLHLGYTETFKYIGSEDSLIPKTFFYKILGNINGYKTTLLKASTMVSSVQAVYEFLEDTFAFDDQEQTEETTQGDVFTVEKITKILNLEHPMKEQVEGNLALRFGTLQRFFAFDNHTIESFPETINKYVQMLSQGKVYNYQKFFSNYEVTIGLPTATGLPFVYTLDTPMYVGLKGKVQVELPEIKTSRKGYKIPQTATVSTNFEVTYSVNKHGQISFVTPYDHQRYIAGYKKQAHFNLPVKGSLTVDIPKRHLQLEVKPVDKRGDYKIVHYSTIPYTAVQNVVDFKPITQGTNTKVTEPKTFKQINEHYGGKYLGMTFRLEGKTGKRNVDLKKLVYDLFERHDLTSGTIFPTVETSIDSTHVDLYFDSKLSTVEGLGLTATYRQVTPKEVQHETDTKKAFVPTPDAQTRVKQFYEQASAGIKGATVYVLDLGLKVQGSKPIQYVGTIACARSPIDAPTKVLAYLHKSGSENYEICYEQRVTDAYVSPVDLEKAIQTEAHSEVTAELKFGEKCGTGAKVVLNGKLERTQERREYVQTLPQVQKCKTEMQQGIKYSANCRNATLQAGLLDKYRFTVKYEGVPETIKNVTYHTYSLLRHFGYPYVTERLTFGENTQGQQQVELDVNFSPDLKTTNIYVSAPTGVAEFRDVHVGKYTRTLAVVHPVTTVLERLGWTTLRQQYDAYCTIDKFQTKTFDNQTYSAHLGNNWHVMTVSVPKTNEEKKTQPFKEFSVLVREATGNTKEVQFTFNYAKGPVVTIVPSQGKTHGTVTVNGQEVHFDEKGYYEYKTKTGTVVFQVYVLPTQELKFVAGPYGFEFLYDQTRVQLSLSHTYKNRVGGLCGVYNGEQFNYVTPERYILKSPEEFAATWALTNEGTVGELKKKAHEHSVYKKTTHYTTVIGSQDNRNYEIVDTDDYDTNSSGESLGHKCTTKRIMVVERDGKHCFSVHPQTACKTGCQVEKTRSMTADFICVNKTQTSSHWAQMVARGAQPNFKNKGNAQKIQFEAPEVCTE
ncbi:hypothetical protein RUM44_006591 [Polyplax serrata]|uniref:Vitellogenin n=1 Tax=Polyplax serrata TaxID=468196 RepID=A0ABR1AIJ5_POLSC